MPAATPTFPSREVVQSRRPFSLWDLIVIPLVFGFILVASESLRGAAAPFAPGTPDLTVSLNPALLPFYALRSSLRMLAAIAFSLVFTFAYATAAARSPRLERLLIPILDFLQSLPILGFLTASAGIFIGLANGSIFGLEMASVFAVFTSQAWNMTFSFYQSLRTVPKELVEAAQVLHLSPWRRFWTLEVPFATPALVWNAMMSVSGGWFFVVASEVIAVPGRAQPQFLPGLGSYIGLAIRHSDVRAMAYAALTLLVLVLIYDQFAFRPMLAWADRFKMEQTAGTERQTSWFLTVLRRARFLRFLASLAMRALPARQRVRPTSSAPALQFNLRRAPSRRLLDLAWGGGLSVLAVALSVILLKFLLGAGFGSAGGQVLAPNPVVASGNVPVASITLRRELNSIRLTGTGTVWLSDVCAALRTSGRPMSSSLAAGLGVSRGVCETPIAAPGQISWLEVPRVLLLGAFTAARVVVLMVLASLVWVPIGVAIGLRPKLARVMSPVAQFAAAFPANLIFPVAVILIVRYRLSPEIFTAPLMVLGTQWYILFNVISGASSIPTDLREAAQVTRLGRVSTWRNLILPGIFPGYVTGGITASGGSWNASIVAEVVSWGSVTVQATGLGSYITKWSTGEFNPHVALGMLVMALYVLAFNRLLWRPLYALAEARFSLQEA